MLTKQKNRIIVIIGVLIIGLLLNGCGKTKGSSNMPKGGAPEVAVVTIQEEQMAITTELPGRTSAYLLAEVRPKLTASSKNACFRKGAM